MTSDLKFLNAFNAIPGIGSATLRTLKDHFGTFAVAWAASEPALAEAQLKEEAIRRIVWKRPSLSPDRELERLVRERITLITDTDDSYPAELKEIPYPPIALYVRGAALVRGSIRCAIVGSRKPTHYGLEACESIAGGLADAGVAVVSGLAMGIDARAHETAVSRQAKTIAVLGSGCDDASLFPKENIGLLRRIIDTGGSIMSEYAPGTPAIKEHFPQRNRIVSGISRGIVVVEARTRSGALITARLALEQNRDVFAVPGSMFSLYSEGPHRLIRDGARLITSTRDILEEWNMEYTIKETGQDTSALGATEERILALLGDGASIDALKEATGFETSAIVTALSLLELQGHIRNIGSDTYQRA